MRRNRILLVDDELPAGGANAAGHRGRTYMTYYVQALVEAGFHVVEETGVDGALRRVESGEAFDLIIVDIMMPPGNSFKNVDTMRGLRSGLFLIERIRGLGLKTPIFAISNLDGIYLAALLEAGKIQRALFKLDVEPSDLAEEVNQFFDEQE